MDLEYWTAASVLIVHAAIAYADALSIKQAGIRNSSDNHDETLALLDDSVAASIGRRVSGCGWNGFADGQNRYSGDSCQSLLLFGAIHPSARTVGHFLHTLHTIDPGSSRPSQ